MIYLAIGLGVLVLLAVLVLAGLRVLRAIAYRMPHWENDARADELARFKSQEFKRFVALAKRPAPRPPRARVRSAFAEKWRDPIT